MYALFPILRFLLQCCVFVMLLLPSQCISAQGQLLLVGGGSEEQGGWSDQPYGWLVDQAPNQRIAILNDSPSTQWLPNYFDSLGANYAKNFVIDSQLLANDQATYDSLITYDAIFIKGGDQWNYYQLWNNTKVEQAIMQVFNNGGVIGGTSAGMAVLGGVDFTAENGTIYPDEALSNVTDAYVKLDTGFLPLYPNYLFDSHFVERGRLGRLVGFLANRYVEEGETLSGIGVDDKTALAIRPDSTGVVFGSAAVTLMRSQGSSSFDKTSAGTPVLVDSLTISKALNGDTIDFAKGDIKSFPQSSYVQKPALDHIPKILMSGSDSISKNQNFLQYLANNYFGNDTIVLMTGHDTTLADQYKTALNGLGNFQIFIKKAVSSTANQSSLAKLIQNTYQFLFVGNQISSFTSFLNGGKAGTALLSQATSVSSAFVGNDSRLAGETMITNYRTKSASYDGLLGFQKGLDILSSTVIMPNTYLTFTDDYYENTISGASFAMTRDSLKWGIWLTPGNFIETHSFTLTEGGTIVNIQAHGNPPVMLAENISKKRDFASMPVSSATNNPRQVVGFDKILLHTLGDGQELQISSTVNSVSHLNKYDESAHLYPNPANQRLRIELPKTADNVKRIQMLNTVGEVIKTIDQKQNSSHLHLSVSDLQPGLYLLHIQTAKSAYNGKFVKE